MRILEIITVPFFTPRGTSFSSLERTKALSELGHSIDILTYSLGDDVSIDNVRIHRIPRVPGIRSIAMGPSFKKLILDALLALKTTWWLFFRGPWDIVYVHEEAAYWTAPLKPLLRGRLLYDMHSSLVEQLSNFGYSESGLVRRVFSFFEGLALRNADGVIVICGELEDIARATAAGVPTQLIEGLPVVGWELPEASDPAVSALRRRFALDGCRVVLYTGSFGQNQGLELAIDAMQRVAQRLPDVRMLLVGGTTTDLERVQAHAAAHDPQQAVRVAGIQPYADMPAFMAMAEVLLSPRTRGINVPLKIYSYLAAGKPMVATDLPAHTQALSAETAELVAPTAEAMAEGIVRVLSRPEHARALAAAARRLAEDKYGAERHRRQIAAILGRIAPDAAAATPKAPA